MEAAGQAPVVTFSPKATVQDVEFVTKQLRERKTGIEVPKSAKLVMFRKVDLVVYEHSTFVMPGQAGQAREIAGAIKSRLEEHCETHDIPLQPVNPSTIKAFALPDTRPKERRKKGDPPRERVDRGKPAMRMAAGDRLSREYPNDRRLKVRVTRKASKFGPDIAEWQLNEHEADALWLYWWAMENCK